MLLTRTSRPAEVKERSFDEIIALLDGNGLGSSAGVTVTTSTALQQATVWACVRIISEVVAQLPIFMQVRRAGRWVDLDDHPALRLLAEPNQWQTPHELIAHLMVWAELRGNGYYLKATSADGRIQRLMPLQGDGIEVRQLTDWSLEYKVSGENGVRGQFGSDQILHFRNFGTSGYMGLSTIGNLRNTIGLALRTEEHGARLFSNGSQLGTVFMLPAAKAEQVEQFTEQLRQKHQGAQNAHKPFVVGGGVEVKELGMSNEDAQFLETRHFSKQEIASAFGVPLFILNDTKNSTTWGTGLEQQLRAFKTLSLQPRLDRLAQTLRRELLLPNERGRIRFVFDTDELTLGDFKDRMEGYAKGIEAGILNPNEAREIEGRNPREGGDDYRQPMNIGIEGQTDEDEATDPTA